MLRHKDNVCIRIGLLSKPPVVTPPQPPVNPVNPPRPVPKKIIKPYHRQVVFPQKRLESKADPDAYIEQIRKQLETLMQNCDGIEWK